MKKLFAIVLLCSFTVQVTGYHFLFHIRQSGFKKSARKRIRRGIEEEQAEQFVFTIAEAKKLVQWQGNDEFRFQGEMYDVIEKNISNGKIYIRCISDKKETELVKNYRKIAKDDFGGPAKKRTSLLVKLIASFYTSLPGTVMETPARSGKTSWFTYQSSLAFNPVEVLTPPPQFM